MPDTRIIDAMWDDSPIDVSTEVNFIWSIANKLRGPYQSDKYKDVIIPMTIIRRFECALAPTKDKVVAQYEANPAFPVKAMYRVSGFQFFNTSRYTLAELVNDSDHLAANFRSYLQGFSPNVLEILMSAEKGLDFGKQIDKMDKNNRLLSVVKAFSELDLDPRTIDNVKMGYIFEELIRKFSENAEAGDHYTGRDIIKLMVNILLAEGCDDIFDDGKVITILDPACGSGSLLLKALKVLGKDAVKIGFFGQEINITTYNLCRINMFLHDVDFDKFDIQCEDTLINPKHWDDEPFELIVSNPPYSIKWEGDDNPLLINDPRFSPAGVLAPKSKADLAFIMHSLSWLAPNGTAAIVCFPGIMYRGGAEQKIRRYLVDNNYVDCIIQLPAKKTPLPKREISG